MEKVTSENVLEKWANQYESVQIWLANLQRKAMSAFNLYRFCQWIQKTPDELLAMKEDPASKDIEYALDRFKISKDYTISVKRVIIIAVKSFFKWNYRPISSAAGLIDYAKEKPYHRLTKEDLRKIWRACYNPRDRFLTSLTFSSAIAKESITYLKWGHLEEYWRKQEYPHLSLEDKIIKGHGRGRYRGVRQETFITGESKKDLTEYVDFLEKLLERPLTPEDSIFINVQKPYDALSYTNITRIFLDLRDRSGVKFSAHDGRRWVENALENARIHPNRCRKIRGRKVKGEEAPYSQPEIEALRTDYAKAVPDLEFQTETLLTEMKKRQELSEKLMDKSMRGEPWTDEERELVKRYGIGLRETAHKRTEPNGGSTDCQRIVNEDQLEEYLLNGWQVKAVLPSGRIVISNKG